MSTDAIVILKNDHKTIKKLFQQFPDAGDGPPQAKGRIVRRIIELKKAVDAITVCQPAGRVLLSLSSPRTTASSGHVRGRP